MENKPCQTRFCDYLIRKSDEFIRKSRRQTGENYRKFGKCLKRFLGDRYEELNLKDITEELVSEYESYLKGLGIGLSTISYYNRIFRSLYNRAAQDGLIKNTHPFDNAYTKVIARRKADMVDVEGEPVTLESLSKEDVIRRYRQLSSRYNNLMSALRGDVKV